MNIYRELLSLNFTSPTVCGLGNFDGVHLGHQKLIKELVRQAKIKNIKSTIITFEPHPSEILCPNKADSLLLTSSQKEKIIRNYGVDNLVCAPFTKDFSKMEYMDFIHDILIKRCKSKVIVVGFNYRFGYEGKGTAQVIKDVCHKEGVDAIIVSPVTYEGTIISSSYIRNLVKSGDVKKAGFFMSRPFSIEGTVIHGDARGRKLGFPTANICFSEKIVLPANGVYAVFASWQDKIFKGIANLGKKPTFNDDKISLEVHLFDFCKQIYGENLEVFFIEILRNEIKFESAAALIDQVKNDFIKAKKIL